MAKKYSDKTTVYAAAYANGGVSVDVIPAGTPFDEESYRYSCLTDTRSKDSSGKENFIFTYRDLMAKEEESLKEDISQFDEYTRGDFEHTIEFLHKMLARLDECKAKADGKESGNLSVDEAEKLHREYRIDRAKSISTIYDDDQYKYIEYVTEEFPGIIRSQAQTLIENMVEQTSVTTHADGTVLVHTNAETCRPNTSGELARPLSVEYDLFGPVVEFNLMDSIKANIKALRREGTGINEMTRQREDLRELAKKISEFAETI